MHNRGRHIAGAGRVDEGADGVVARHEVGAAEVDEGEVRGGADLDAADADANASTTAVGVSDHDGLVVRLATDRIFADSFGGDQ